VSLDSTVVRLAKGKNLATVVTLMPDGQVNLPGRARTHAPGPGRTERPGPSRPRDTPRGCITER
jgi:hypothetical protein